MSVGLAAAQTVRFERKAIDHAIAANNFSTANKMLQENVGIYFSSKNIDSLVACIALKGQIVKELKGDKEAVAAIYSFINQIKTLKPATRQLAKAYDKAAFFFYSNNIYSQAYAAGDLALKQYLQLSPPSNEMVADAYYLLGEYASHNNDMKHALLYHRQAYQMRIGDKQIPLKDAYNSVAAMAKMMLVYSITDSALAFYHEALDILAKMPRDNDNSYHDPATVYKNMAIISNMEGKTHEAIRYSYKSIELLKQYIKVSKDEHSIQRGKTDLCRTIENLSVYYSQLGNIGRANDLLIYSYKIKIATLKPNDGELLKTEVLLGSNYNNIGDYDKSRYYLIRAIERSKNMDEGAHLLSLGDAWYIMATVSTNLKKKDEAKRSFEVADSLYEIAYQGAYDDMYGDFVKNITVFYAKNDEYKKALQKANQAYERLPSKGKNGGLREFYQILNIATIHYHGKNYGQALEYSNRALLLINRKLKEGGSRLDSVKMEFFKPQAIFVNASARYELEPVKNQTVLQQTMQRLDQALEILEGRKGFLDEAYNLQFIIEYNRELIEFSKKIALELHLASADPKYLERFINLHESSLYNRIRSRLDQEEAIRFSNVPQQIIAEETSLKARIRNTLTEDTEKPDVINDYLQAVTLWEQHLERVKRDFPSYYQLRYATLFKPLPQLQSSLPEDATLVRFYFVDTALVVLVADSARKNVVTLSTAGLEKLIGSLQSNLKEDAHLAVLHQVYKQLWTPLEKYISTPRVVIIPDGFLYSLSFDMLATKPVNSYKQLTDHSLLARHSLTYHYSLFMLRAQQKEISFSNNYVAFAPGFSDKMKNEYATSKKDTLHLDQAYLTLLPQPTTTTLTKHLKKQLNGEVYTESASTRKAFEKNAGGHKVIHIATHAEFNNVYPQKSGLIFAKGDGGNDSNRLYLSDIYNCDLRSEITLLTACETGRPGYQDGEGMVSLAHAFNFAGSNSILMALWKVDEHASSDITKSFMAYVKAELTTDEALRRAKLDYLKKSEGRLSHPAYWSGLILLGEPAIIHFNQSYNKQIGWWVLVILAALTLVGYILFQRKRRSVS